jgi:hypothetical protein
VLDVLGPSLPTGLAASTARLVRLTQWATTIAAAVALLADSAWLDLRIVTLRRGALVVFVGALGGAMLRVQAYPDLLSRISPGRAVGVWNEKRRTGDALGLLGVDETRFPGVRAASDEHDVMTLRDRSAAATWLADTPPPARRFLALAPADLPSVNAAFRSRGHGNLPIVSSSGAFLLGVDELAPGEKSESPLDEIVRSSAPETLTPLSATLGDALDVVGWELANERRAHVPAFTGRAGHVRIAVRVRNASALAGHCTFLHVDHTPTRFGAEHRTHAYPIGLWRNGDVIVDDFDVDLPASFRKGAYATYWGVGVLPCQVDRRLPVTDGPTDGHHRVALGALEVR